MPQKVSKIVRIEFDSWVRFLSEMHVLLSECQVCLKFKVKMRRFREIFSQILGTVKLYSATI